MKKLLLLLVLAGCNDPVTVQKCLPRCYYTRLYASPHPSPDKMLQIRAYCRNQSEDVIIATENVDGGIDKVIELNNLPKCESYLVH